jgi:hypothetical protein
MTIAHCFLEFRRKPFIKSLRMPPELVENLHLCGKYVAWPTGGGV